MHQCLKFYLTELPKGGAQIQALAHFFDGFEMKSAGDFEVILSRS